MAQAFKVPVIEGKSNDWADFDVDTLPPNMKKDLEAIWAHKKALAAAKAKFEGAFIPAYEKHIQATPDGMVLRCSYGWGDSNKLATGYYEAKARKDKVVRGFKAK